MASPVSRTLTDEGGRDALTRALEEHSKHPEAPLPSRYIGPSGSEGPSRAASSDGDPEERMEEMREQMDVYVDPGERDGLPTLPGGKGVEERSNKAAWGLVRGVTNGAFGLRGRKNAGFKGGQGKNADGAAPTEGAEKVRHHSSDPEKEITGAGTGGGGFFHNPFRAEADLSSTEPPSLQNQAAPSGGILSALIALQQQQANASNGGASGATSGATTPTSLAPSRGGSTTAYSSDEDEEEEIERLKFLKKQKEKRQNRTAAQKVVDGVGGTAKGVVGGVGKGVYGAGSTVVGTAGSALGFNSKAHSRAPSGDVTPAVQQGGSKTPPMDKKKKSLFGEVKKAVGKGMDDSDRPDAAKSGAGVIGGLMLSTVSFGLCYPLRRSS